MEPASGRRRPAVSVVLPTNNRPVWLEQAVTSVLDGEYEDFEVIVSNNGRPEDTGLLSERIDDARVRWIEQPPSCILENFLSAMSLARGDYVAVLHDDDWWHPKLLARLLTPLRSHPEAVVAFCDPWHVTPEGQIDLESSDFFSTRSGRATLKPGLHQPFTALAAREGVSFAGSVFRRDAVSIDDFPSEVGAALDVWNAYLLAVGGRAAYFCPDRLVYVRMHRSNFALSPTENLVAAAYCQRRMLVDPRMAAHRDELRRRLAARQQTIGASLLRQGSRSAARNHLAAALRLRPTAKGLGGWVASWAVPMPLLARL